MNKKKQHMYITIYNGSLQDNSLVNKIMPAKLMKTIAHQVLLALRKFSSKVRQINIQ